jgi:glutamyl-tRNA synthetase
MVITRIAPSPTGFLHVGHLRTALFSFALAKKNKGKFILRIEDTDRKRFVPGAIENIIKTMNIFKINFDEGPTIGGPDAPYIQSERLEIYQKKAQELIDKGWAYYCFLTEEELNDLKGGMVDKTHADGAFRSPYRDKPREEAEARIAKGEKYVIRLRVPVGEEVVLQDVLLGTVKWNTDDVDDQILLKSDGFPTYHLAVVVDDVLMGITHITRGIEWLPSVPKHILIYRAFDYKFPLTAHMPVILDPEGGKLSKRKGAVSTEAFLADGYLPEALLNFIMLLGWSSPIEHEFGEKEREFFTLKEFVELFDMKDLNKSNPVFNREKLIWFNQKYIQALSGDELVKRFSDWLVGKDEYKELSSMINKRGNDYLEKVLKLEQERVKLLKDFTSSINFFYDIKGKLDFSTVKQTKNLTVEQISGFFHEFLLFLDQDFDGMTHELWEDFVRNYAGKKDLKAGSLFMALRLAVTDSQFSPPLLEVVKVLGKDEVKKRIDSYIKK